MIARNNIPLPRDGSLTGPPGPRGDAAHLPSHEPAPGRGIYDHGQGCDCPVCRDRYRQGRTVESHDASTYLASICVLAVGVALLALTVGLLLT